MGWHGMGRHGLHWSPCHSAMPMELIPFGGRMGWHGMEGRLGPIIGPMPLLVGELACAFAAQEGRPGRGCVGGGEGGGGGRGRGRRGRGMRAAALGAALLALAAAGGAGALELAQKGSHVLELFADDFDENKVPIYDGPGEFIAVAFYAPWCQQVHAALAPLPPSAFYLHPPLFPSPRRLPTPPSRTAACRWSDPCPSTDGALWSTRRTSLCRSTRKWRKS